MAMPGEEESYATRYFGVGCLTFFAGLFSGGMIGVFIAKVVGSFRGCRPDAGLPACDWHLYAAVGMLVGAVTLPVLAIGRLMQSDRARNSERG